MYIDPYAWLYWKTNFIQGMTENPGYAFLTIHTVLLIVIAWYARRVYKLLKKGWDIKLWRE
ncbi:MAG: hypothetical protein ACXABN_19090 [Candidatus Thorarchaeota archaeon]|jgi:hypothetical protein